MIDGNGGVSINPKAKSWTLMLVLLMTAPSFFACAMATAPASHAEADVATMMSREMPSQDEVNWINPTPGLGRYWGVAYDPAGSKAALVGTRGAFITYDGAKFENMNPSTSQDLLDIAWRPAGDYALVVGGWGVVLKWDGGVLQKLRSNNQYTLKSIAWDEDGQKALMCSYDGMLITYEHATGKFGSVASNTTLDLNNVTYDVTFGWMIVGQNGTVLKYDGTSVTSVPSGTLVDLFNADWRSGIAIIVGQDGTMLKYSAGKITDAGNTYAKDKDLSDIAWKPGSDYALVVGQGGTMLKYTASGVTQVDDTGTTDDLYRIGFKSAILNDAIIGGALNTVIRFDGTKGTSLVTNVYNNNFRAVSWKPGGSSALIVGSNGAALRYNNTMGVSYVNTYTNNLLWGVDWRPDGTEALIVGDQGTFITYNGTNMTNVTSGVNKNLRGVSWRHDGQFALAVGDGGTVLRYEPGGLVTKVPLEDNVLNDMWDVTWQPMDDYAIVVGASGFIFRCALADLPPHELTCTRVTSGFISYQTVSYSPDGSMILVGGFSGYVGSIEGNTVKKITSPTGQTILDISWKPGTQSAIITCGEGVVLKMVDYSLTGKSLIKLPVPSVASLYGIDWNGNTALMVGDRGQIFKYYSAPVTEPSAVILAPYDTRMFSLDQTITLDGTKSLSPEDGAIDFTWKANGTKLLSNAPKEDIPATDLGVGYHTITLTVSASGGRLDVDTVHINVVLDPKPPKPVISSPLNGSVFLTTDAIEFDGRNSTDPNNDGLLLHWLSNSSFVGFIATGDHFFKKVNVAGLHTLTLWANDSKFNVSTSVNITVNLPNDAPVIEINEPANGTERFHDEAITFIATATDPDGDLLDVGWISNISGLLAFEDEMLMTLPAGIHNITFYADDGHGHNISESIVVIVNQRIPPNEKPILAITGLTDGQDVKEAINITGTVMDGDPAGYITKLEIQVGDSEQWENIIFSGEAWSWAIDTEAYPNGPLNIVVRAYDDNNSVEFLNFGLNVVNRWKNLRAAILKPVEMAPVDGKVRIEGWGEVLDDIPGQEIARVEIKITPKVPGAKGGIDWTVAGGQTQWFYEWDTLKASNGEFEISARVVDETGVISPVDSINVTVDNKPVSVMDNLMSGGLLLPLLLLIIVLVVIVLVAFIRSKGRRDENEEEEDEGAEDEAEEEEDEEEDKDDKEEDEKEDEAEEEEAEEDEEEDKDDKEEDEKEDEAEEDEEEGEEEDEDEEDEEEEEEDEGDKDEKPLKKKK